MSEISKERVEAMAANILECHDVKPSEVKALAGLALLALRERAEPEPFCRISAIEKTNIDMGIYAIVDIPSRHPTDIPLYAAPPAPVVLRERAVPDYYVVVTSAGVWQSFHRNRAEAEFIVNKPFNPGYSVLEIYTAPPAPVVADDAQPERGFRYNKDEPYGVQGSSAAPVMDEPVSQPYKLPVGNEEESKRTKN